MRFSDFVLLLNALWFGAAFMQFSIAQANTLKILVPREERGNPMVDEWAQNDRLDKIQRILRKLDEREQQIIIGRFGLDHNREPLTLKEVGAEMGVTKERIRQIEARALNKLRLAAQEEKISLDW